MIGGIRGTFHGDDDVASLDEAIEAVPAQLAQGYTAICFKPSQYVDEVSEVPALCRRVVERVARAAA